MAPITTPSAPPALGERREREQRRGRVAAGIGDQLRGPDPRRGELGEPVDGVLQQLGRAVGAVRALVDRGSSSRKSAERSTTGTRSPEAATSGAAAACG